MTREDLYRNYFDFSNLHSPGFSEDMQSTLLAMSKDDRVQVMTDFVNNYIAWCDESIVTLNKKITDLQAKRTDADTNWRGVI